VPLPLDSDAERVRDLVRAALATHPGVLATPEPSVLLDAIEGGSLIFIAIAYIDNPRQTGTIRSDLLLIAFAPSRAISVCPGALTPESGEYNVACRGLLGGSTYIGRWNCEC